MTWLTAAYLRKVARGDTVVLAVRARGRWTPLRCDIVLEEPATASLVRIRDALEALETHDELDLEATAAALGLTTTERDNGLCDTAVTLAGTADEAPLPESIALGVHFAVTDDTLSGELAFRPDCFDARDVAAMPGHFEALIRGFASGIHAPLLGSSVLSQAETRELLIDPNETRVDLAGFETIPAAFARIASERRESVAVISGETELTYTELAARVQRVAQGLCAAGIAPGSRVGVLCNRDEWLAPTLLGILTAGCAYVPLDPEYPRDRIQWILEDCDAAALLASSGLELPARAPRTFRVDELAQTEVRPALLPSVTRSDAAYFIYTSGSTGMPKGVRINHENLTNFCAGMDALIPRGEAATWLAITSISFDISVLELLWTLSRGVRVVLQQAGRLLDADAPKEPRSAPAFSLFFFADCDEEHAAQHYDLLFRGAELADREGLDAVWVPERHFHRFGGLFPNPSVAAAALAARTRRISIRAGSIVSPLHNSLRIAEEWSFVDNISKGRVGVSFASGWNPRDFVLAPEAFAERRQRIFRDIDVVRRFWRGESQRLPGGDAATHEVHLYPKPVQPELPIWMTASDSIETFKKAGELGVNVLTHLLHHSLEELERKIEAYRAAYREHRGEDARGRVTVMVHTFIGESEAQVLDAVREPFLRYLSSSAELMRLALPKAAGVTLSEEDRAAIVEAAFGRFFEERGLFGTPESCLPKVRRLQDAGIDEIACLVDFIPDQRLVYEHLRQLCALRALANEGARHRDVAGQIEAHRVTHLQCTPSLAKSLMASSRFRQSLRHLEVFAIGGEAFPSGLIQDIRRCSKTAVLNMYGPTETTVWSTVHELGDGDNDVPLGRPIANTQVYVLGPDLSPLPRNRAGELCIGGRGVAAGYWNRPELTAEKFVKDPFSSRQEDRLYRTGDLVEWAHDGTLRFLGRIDRQVKIRGHRIEPGEIESRLRAHAEIREVLVVNRKVGSTEQLCAYYRSDVPLDARELAKSVAAGLPAYMVPEYFVRIEAFPLTPNRKVDVRALPDPVETSADAAESHTLEPATLALLDVWRRVLGRDLGPKDDFFRAGGDSIQAIQAAAQANALGFSVSPKLIYEHPTAERLAKVVSAQTVRVEGLELPKGPIELLFAQKWFFEMQVPQRNHWNQSLLLELREGVAPDSLRRAVHAAFARHPALRLRFHESERGWSQEYAPPGVGIIDYLHEAWRGDDRADTASAIERYADRAHRSLDLAAGPLAAALHLSGFPRADVLLLSAHHLVVDGLSWRILLEDIERSYRDIVAGGAGTLPPAPGPHRVVSSEPNPALESDSLAAARFYQSKLALSPEPIWEPCEVLESDCRTLHAEAPAELDELAGQLKTDAEGLLLSAFVRAMRLAGVADGLAIDMETHGRSALTSADASSAAVGWLTRIYPVILEGGATSPELTLREVKTLLHEVAPHRDLFSPPEGWRRPQIIFNYLGQLDAPLQGSQLFSSLRLSPGSPRDPGAVRHHVLEVNVHQSHGRVVWELIYPPALIADATAQKLTELCRQSLDELSRLSPDAASECLLPEDFPLSSLDAAEVRSLACRRGGLLDAFPATIQQRSMFFQLHACPSDKTRYVHQALIALEGCDDEARLGAALAAVSARHGAFRSSFCVSRAGVLVQTVAREATMPIRHLDWSSLPAREQQARLEVLRKLDFEQGLDPSSAPLARVILIRTQRDAYYLLWTYHHLIADGWSLPLVIRDLEQAYVEGRASQPVGDFGAFARWLARLDKSQQEAFWVRYLADMKPPALLSPSGRKTDFSYRVEYGTLNESLSESQLARWESGARDEGATLPAFLQAAWGLALCRLSRRHEACFGVTVAGRAAHVPDVEHTVGLFIHGVPLRFRLRPSDTPSSLIRRVHEEGAQLREHAYVEPAFINRAMGLDGGQLAFESVFVIANFIRPEDGSAPRESQGLRLQALDLVEQNSVPLAVTAVWGDRLHLRYSFDSRHFDASRVREIHRTFVAALDDLVLDPRGPVRVVEEHRSPSLNGASKHQTLSSERY